MNQSVSENQSSGNASPAQLPLVSVIIPAYNAEEYVLEALRSVLDQDYEPVEVLVIDDGSSDGTVDLVRREAPQVKIIQQANAGAAAARNTGLRCAKGELICLLDADDGWFPGKLAAQVDYLQRHPEVGLVFHHWLVWEPDATGAYITPTRSVDPVPGEIDLSCSGWIYPQLLLDCAVHTSTVMMRREVVRNIGFFDTSLVTGDDYNYWLRISRKYEIHKLTGIYSFYRTVVTGITNKVKLEDYEYRVIKNAIEQWGLSSEDGSSSLSQARANQRLSKLALDHGYGHFHYGSIKVAKTAFLRALRHQPLNVRAIGYLIAAQFRGFFISR